MQRRIIALALLMAGAATALADEQRGFYAGTAVGQFNLAVDDRRNFAADDSAFRIFAGWRLTRVIALELAYTDLGSPEQIRFDDCPEPLLCMALGRTRISAAGFAPYVVTTVPLGAFELNAKLGYFFYDFEFTLDSTYCDQNPNGCTNPLDRVKERDERFTYALGMGAVVLDRVNIRLEYEAIDISGSVDNASVFWASAAWRF